MEQESREQELARLRKAVRMYELIFNSIHHGAMVTDAQGRITHFNKPYGQFLGLDPTEHLGRHCTETVENTRMHLVAQTGKAEINATQEIKGQSMVVQRIPIRQDGKVIAVYGQVVFKDVRDVGRLAKKLSLLESKVKLYEQELINLRSTRYTFQSIVGGSKAMRALKKEALKAAANDLPVLLTGESGTGKELFAQAIHQGSPRKMHPFVRINCAAIPRDLLESELFGYEKGAFTGARAGGKPGKLELAHRGTLFLDEIGDLPLEMQPKLLRALEEKEFERVGGTKPLRSDFRVVAATNQSLQEMIAQRAFRSDLFYRLNVIPLRIPPLRERRGDIGELAGHFLAQMAGEMALPSIKLDPEAGRVLGSFAWPGNVRELSNVLERAVFNLEGDTIRLSHLPLYLHREAGDGDLGGATIKSVQAQAEADAIRMALKESGYNKALAARRLGIHRTLLYKKMKKYGLPLKP
ncbi:MAG: sigma 54-interacting transcriptional regulator [Deltaproteobacteria bacterium]|nr:sigma 54-interacting transcriptional regulator [Deltaproteobacteria bacterium]